MKQYKYNCTASFIAEQLEELKKLSLEEKIKLCKLILGEKLFNKTLEKYKNKENNK